MSIFIFSQDNPIRQNFYTGEHSAMEDEGDKLCTEDLPTEYQAPCLGSARLSPKSREGEDEAQPLLV